MMKRPPSKWGFVGLSTNKITRLEAPFHLPVLDKSDFEFLINIFTAGR